MTKTESIGETVSKDEVLALINKAMDNTDNKDIQDYIFCGLRRDVNNLPSINRPKGEWVKATGMMPPEFHGHHCCSECGNFANMEPPFGNREDLSNFCPNCGARMKGGAE